MGLFEDLTEKKFGRLTVESKAPRQHKKTYWNCVCDCGNRLQVWAASLKSGRSKSCGCLRAEITSLRLKGKAIKHGMWRSPEFKVWSSMLYRCHNTRSRAYNDYGGRGITVCDSWRRSFANFYRDMEPRPTGPKRYSIERINNNLGYSPENCKWATFKEQSRNRRDNVVMEGFGQIRVLLDWSTELGISYDVIKYMRNKGKSIEQIAQERGVGLSTA